MKLSWSDLKLPPINLYSLPNYMTTNSCLKCVHHKPTLDEAMGCQWCLDCRDFNNYTENMNNTNKSESPLSFQVGGNHYVKLKIQPIEYSMANNLDACQHSIVKYVTRFRDKGGVQDLEKAQQFLDILKEHYSRETTKGN